VALHQQRQYDKHSDDQKHRGVIQLYIGNFCQRINHKTLSNLNLTTDHASRANAGANLTSGSRHAMPDRNGTKEYFFIDHL